MSERCWCGGKTVVSFHEGHLVCLESRYHDPRATGEPGEIRKIYISGPMSWKPECNYPAFGEAEQQLTSAGYQVVNPANSELSGAHYTDLLREDFRWLLGCDGVAVLPGWTESTGACHEVQIAELLKMPIRTVADWVKLSPDYTCAPDPCGQ